MTQDQRDTATSGHNFDNYDPSTEELLDYAISVLAEHWVYVTNDPKEIKQKIKLEIIADLKERKHC